MSSNKGPLKIHGATLAGHGDPVSPAGTHQETRRYERLSEEGKHAVLSDWRSSSEGGFSQPISENSHRFFRGRDSMKENRRIAAFRCVGIVTLGLFRPGFARDLWRSRLWA
jgi:hypothetical protein